MFYVELLCGMYKKYIIYKNLINQFLYLLYGRLEFCLEFRDLIDIQLLSFFN